MNQLFPIFIKADEINILLIGGGNIAEEKLHFLLKSSPKANIQIITKKANKWVFNMVKKNTNISLMIRPFTDSDIINKHLIIAATNSSELNTHLRALANKNNILLNIADKSTLCDFYLGGIVTKGDLKLAISTNGKSPILAKRLRQFFEAELPNQLDEIIDDLKNLRLKLNGSFDKKLNTLNELTKQLIENE